MDFPSHYDPKEVEARQQAFWAERNTYGYRKGSGKPVFSIDTPPPTVSGKLHIGHVFSYTQTDIIARYKRMTGHEVYYPMGFDDNGLPTEILTERECGVKADRLSREEFGRLCLETSRRFHVLYRALWQSLGFSVDWAQSYSTIAPENIRVSQLSFLDLARKGRIYRQRMPSLWCTKCRTSFAQAELDAVQQPSTFYHFHFRSASGEQLPVASTRPELLPSCVAVFIHPDNPRHRHLIGTKALTPVFGQEVPIIGDRRADPEKGTGIVMCCTFGDATDVAWYKEHGLPLRITIAPDGRMNAESGMLAGMTIPEARKAVVERLKADGLLYDEKPIPAEAHVVNTHERCGTAVEYLDTQQWFIRLLDCKDELIRRGAQVNWYPKHMEVRFRNWVEGLSWDWAISRQRYFGVPVPAWSCAACGEAILAREDQLPVNPLSATAPGPCPACGSAEAVPEKDVLDTWATSSVTPQICQRWGTPEENAELRPMSMRPQAHDIIRTWAFYTIAKSHFHFGDVPWKDAVISGHVVKRDAEVQADQVAGSQVQRKSKISKSKDKDAYSPVRLIEEHSADGIRFWTSGGKLGLDVAFDEKEIAGGQRLFTKLWNASKFVLGMLEGFDPRAAGSLSGTKLAVTDRALLSRLSRAVERYHEAFGRYEYALARAEAERFFWSDLCDDYIEYSKDRLYQAARRGADSRLAAQKTLYHALYAVLRMFAPFIPHITEEIYQKAFRASEEPESIHRARLPEAADFPRSEDAETRGELMKRLVDWVRGSKSRAGHSLKQPVAVLSVKGPDAAGRLAGLEDDLLAITTSAKLDLAGRGGEGWEPLPETDLQVRLEMDAAALEVTRLAGGFKDLVAAGKKAVGLKANAMAGELEICAGPLAAKLAGTEDLFAAALKVQAVRFVASAAGLTPGAGGELHGRYVAGAGEGRTL